MANGTKLKKPFDRQLALERLARAGVRPVSIAGPGGSSVISHLEASESVHIGLKLWGYIDSLNSRLVRT